jgi:hypothetical protein
MPDETPAPKPRQSFHVASHHAPKPRLRVVPVTEPPRTVTYAGVEFEVMFDGTPQRAIVEEA